MVQEFRQEENSIEDIVGTDKPKRKQKIGIKTLKKLLLADNTPTQNDLLAVGQHENVFLRVKSCIGNS